MIIVLVLIFVIGYLGIAFEEQLHINKTAFSLIIGVLCWTVLILSEGTFNEVVLAKPEHYHEKIIEMLGHQVGEIAQILFFLLGAMTVVELIDAHHGFDIITRSIKSRNLISFLWLIAGITFFMSALLDNLTTSIVMVSIVRKMVKKPETRLWFAGTIVIVANAGGAWSPIGDVTTTMLWIGGQISAGAIVYKLFLPSLICAVIPVLMVSYQIKKHKFAIEPQSLEKEEKNKHKGQNLIFYLGLAGVLFVPVFKLQTHLPPVMGMLLVLGVLWLVTELIHRNSAYEERYKYTAAHALSRIDSGSILFFMGILLAISALDTAGVLHTLALFLNDNLPNSDVVAIIIGLLSAVVDNVPLTAAIMGMYDLVQYPIDHRLWEFLAFTAGTGGSALIIGSAAGVAVMGLEKITFGWYLKKMSVPALLGFFAGSLLYICMQ